MTEFDFRPECENCKGIGGHAVRFPPPGAKVLDFLKDGCVVECFKCEGSGRLPYTETVELEERS